MTDDARMVMFTGAFAREIEDGDFEAAETWARIAFVAAQEARQTEGAGA